MCFCVSLWPMCEDFTETRRWHWLFWTWQLGAIWCSAKNWPRIFRKSIKQFWPLSHPSHQSHQIQLKKYIKYWLFALLLLVNVSLKFPFTPSSQGQFKTLSSVFYPRDTLQFYPNFTHTQRYLGAIFRLVFPGVITDQNLTKLLAFLFSFCFSQLPKTRRECLTFLNSLWLFKQLQGI